MSTIRFGNNGVDQNAIVQNHSNGGNPSLVKPTTDGHHSTIRSLKDDSNDTPQEPSSDSDTSASNSDQNVGSKLLAIGASLIRGIANFTSRGIEAVDSEETSSLPAAQESSSDNILSAVIAKIQETPFAKSTQLNEDEMGLLQLESFNSTELRGKGLSSLPQCNDSSFDWKKEVDPSGESVYTLWRFPNRVPALDTPTPMRNEDMIGLRVKILSGVLPGKCYGVSNRKDLKDYEFNFYGTEYNTTGLIITKYMVTMTRKE